MWHSRFSFLPWIASVSFLNVKFSLAKMYSLEFYIWKSHWKLIFFLFSKIFLQCFLFTKWIIVFFNLFLSDYPILWQASTSTSFTVTWTLISDRIAVTVSSRSSSLMLSGIPDKTRLFLQSYCSRSSIDDCRTSTLLSKQSHFARNCALSSWNLFMTMSFRLLKSSLKLLMLLMMLSSRLFNKSVVTAISFFPQVLYSWVILTSTHQKLLKVHFQNFR